MYNIKTKFENCSYDNCYTIEGCATSQLEFTLEAKDFPTMQSKRKSQLDIQKAIKEELEKFKWLIYNDVNFEFTWYFSGIRKKESDNIGDLDNLIKPIIDAFAGENGLYIDDAQIGSLNTLWMSKNENTSSDTILRIFVNFNNDVCCMKENMRFIQLDNSSKLDKNMYVLCHFDESNIDDLYGALVCHHLQLRERKKGRNILNKHPNSGLAIPFNLFHRTRLNGIPNGLIYKLNDFKKECFNAGLSYKKLLEFARTKKRK